MDHFEEKLASFEPRKPSREQREQILANAPGTEPSKKITRKPSPLIALATSRWFLMAVLPLLVFATAGICAVGIDSHGAGNRWQEVKETLTADGETLDFSTFFLPPVPDAENFMATPALHGTEKPSHPRNPEIMAKHDRIGALPRFASPKESEPNTPIDLESYSINYDTQNRDNLTLISTLEGTPEEEILDATNIDQELWVELAAAARRPYSQPVSSMKERLARDGVLALSAGHLGLVQKLVQLSTLRAVAAARLGDQATTRDSLAIILKCRAGAQADPSMISGLVTIAITAILEHKLPDILRADCLTAEDLVWLQVELAQLDGIALGLQMFRSELAWSATYYDELIAMPRKERAETMTMYGGLRPFNVETAVVYVLPRSFFIRNKATSADWNYRLNLKPLKELDFDMMRAAREEFVRIEANQSWFSYGTALAGLGLQDPSFVTSRIIASEMHLRSMTSALALERYRLDHGSFPEELNALVPTYLDRVPEDLAAPDAPKEIGYEPTPDRTSYTLTATPLFSDKEKYIESLKFRR